MRLYLIRHGQSFNNALWAKNNSDKGRSLDPALTDIGRAQAECVAEFLRDGLQTRLPLAGMDGDDARPTLLYTSLMTRAVATGVIVARALQVPLAALPDAHEVGGLYLADETTGEKRGMPGPNRAHFAEHFPELQLADTVDEAGWWNRPYESEEWRTARAARVWQDLRARHGANVEVIGLITHGGFYSHLLRTMLGMPENFQAWFALNNCAVSRIDVYEQEISLVYHNRFDFLPPELIT